MKTRKVKMCDCGFPQSSPKPHQHSLPDKPQHTPTPWVVKETVKSFTTGAGSVEMGEIWLEDGSLRIATSLLRKDAAFIVKAVNAHEDYERIILALKEWARTGKAVSMSALMPDSDQTIGEAIIVANARAEGK